jgi:hypothetical protein
MVSLGVPICKNDWELLFLYLGTLQPTPPKKGSIIKETEKLNME